MQEILIYSSSDKQTVQKYDLLVCPGRQGPKKETSQKRVKRYGSIVELVHFGKKNYHMTFSLRPGIGQRGWRCNLLTGLKTTLHVHGGGFHDIYILFSSFLKWNPWTKMFLPWNHQPSYGSWDLWTFCPTMTETSINARDRIEL